MKKSSIFFRVDGNVEIGMGHLVRCIALAQMLKNNFDIHFACKYIPEDSIHNLNNLGFNLLRIGSEEDFLSALSSDIIVVLDHYDLDTNYQKIIKEKKCKLVCIDDLHDKVFFADLIINHAPNINPSDYHAQIYTQFALGLDYVLLRPVFLKKQINSHHNKNGKAIFVCLGGADIKNITQSIVDILKTDLRFEKIIVVTGATYAHIVQLKESIKGYSKFFLYNTVQPEKMIDLILEADVSIVPSSGILQEVLALGGRVISGKYVENQKYIFENYKALGVFESAEDFSKEAIISAINKYFDGKIKPPKNLIDGKSGDRLLKYFKQFKIEDEVVLRDANETDLLKTFEWANNSTIREFFFNNKPIKFDEHKNWFINKLKEKKCFYYIGVVNNNTFGSIRFDIKEDHDVISYLVDPLYQSNGLGTILLKKGLDLFIKYNRHIAFVYGEVFFGNVASVKIFNRLGYTIQVNQSDKIVTFKKIINNE